MRVPLDTRAEFRALLARRVAVGSLVSLVVLSLIVTVYAVVAIRTTQVGNKSTLATTQAAAASAAQSAQRIIDCTTAGHACYDRQQRQTGSIVGSVNDVTVRASSYAAACAARGLADPDEINQCVLTEFSRHKLNPLGR